MHWELELTLFIFLVVTALLALESRNLLTAVVSLTVFSFLSALLYVAMGAVDVGFTEAVVGGGVSGVLFVVTIFKTTRKCRD
ncbi:MAG TPA: hydrogenase subunit MbhD domain-containing protein [Candidatus Desulfaltia sp.]|nr:hydrogenase subunit MbhD domain-containing protein [Candidatus Desulfaltia sp.]